MRRNTIALIAASAALAGADAASAKEVVTSFEFTDTSGEFTLGDSPETVTFQNGLAQTVMKLHLYHTGLNAWLIEPGETGTITFGTPAQSIDLWLRDQFPGNEGVLTFFDTAGEVISTFEAPDDDFQNITVEPGPDELPISKITLQNNGSDGYTVIDDFTYCAVEQGDPIADPIPETIPASDLHVRLETVATGLTAPNWATFRPNATKGGPFSGDFLFVTDQDGTIWAIDLTEDPPGDLVPFLDVSDQLVDLGVGGPGTFDERGLLGLAFHPNYASNGLLYTYTSEPAEGAADFPVPDGANANHHSVITEWQVAEPLEDPNPNDPDTVPDPAGERELLRIGEPQFNHDGGCLNFGPAGDAGNFLYISLGDGGNADDQGPGHTTEGNGQNQGNVLGTLLRIDPLGSDSTNGEYGIPAGNPFVGDSDVPDEIYAFGFRNPFRFSFDKGTSFNPGDGTLYVGDVGQNDIEEVDIVEAGENYGWRIKEGTFLFDPNGDQNGFVFENSPGSPAGLVDPIAQYDHDEGISVIGGFVYRGVKIPAMQGRYVFGDFTLSFASPQGRLFHLTENNEIQEFQLVGQNEVGLFINGIGADADGELYVLGNETGTPFENTGVVQRIAPKTGDLNADGVTDGADLGQLLGQWGTCATPCSADLNMDGVVDGADLGVLLGSWG